MFLTCVVFDNYVAVQDGVTGQDEPGRLWDVVWMTRFGIVRARPVCDRITVALYVRNDNRAARLVKLIPTCGPLDIDDPQPATTVMMPDKDWPAEKITSRFFAGLFCLVGDSAAIAKPRRQRPGLWTALQFVKTLCAVDPMTAANGVQSTAPILSIWFLRMS